jgi:hypothetical protein
MFNGSVLTRLLEPGDVLLAERGFLSKYKFSRGDVVIFK